MLTFTVEELIQFLSNRTMTFFEGAKRSDDIVFSHYFSIATDKEAVKCLKTPLKKGGYNFEERKVFWNSFFDFKAPKLRLPIHITKLSGKDGFSL